MTIHIIKFAPAALVAFLAGQVGPAFAQDAAAQDKPFTVFENKAKDETLFDFSYVSPSSPALPLVGIEGDQITRIGGLRPFGVALLSGLSGSSSSPAIAIDLAPFWALGRRSTNLADYYRFSPLDRVAARSKASVAVAWGDKTSGRPSSLVFSLGSRLLDAQDKLADRGFDRCLDESGLQTLYRRKHDAIGDLALTLSQQGKTPAEIADLIDKAEGDLAKELKLVDAEITRVHAECVTAQAKRMEAAPGLDAGFAVRFNGQPTGLAGFKQTGAVLWATWTSGLIGGSTTTDRPSGPISGLRARAVVHGRYTLKEAVYNDTFVLQGKRNALALVGGIESVPSDAKDAEDKFRWTLQTGWNRQNAVLPTEVDKNYWRYQAIGHFRIGTGLWLNATLGRVSGKGVTSDTKASIGFTLVPPSDAAKIADAYAGR